MGLDLGEEEMEKEGIRRRRIRKFESKRQEGEGKESEKKRARRMVEKVGSVFRLYLGKRFLR